MARMFVAKYLKTKQASPLRQHGLGVDSMRRAFFNGPFLASFRLFLSFSTVVRLLKNLGATRIQIWIIRAEGENADLYTTTTAPPCE